MQLQAEEKSTYDNVFIHLGTFHITCAFSSMIGKQLAESDGSHILNESHVIEKGFLKSFLSSMTAEDHRREKRIPKKVMFYFKLRNVTGISCVISSHSNGNNVKKVFRRITFINFIEAAQFPIPSYFFKCFQTQLIVKFLCRLPLIALVIARAELY